MPGSITNLVIYIILLCSYIHLFIIDPDGPMVDVLLRYHVILYCTVLLCYYVHHFYVSSVIVVSPMHCLKLYTLLRYRNKSNQIKLDASVVKLCSVCGGLSIPG